MKKGLFLALSSSLALGCASLAAPRVPSLDCVDLIETERHGTVFYSCRQDTTDAVLDAFELIGRVKQYGGQTFDFEETVNYRQYVNTGRQRASTSYRLYIAPGDIIGLEPEERIFIRAPQEYREEADEPIMLWSRLDSLLDEEAYYIANGYDTYRRELTDFSPGATITPEFIATALVRKIEVVLHEDWHYNMKLVWGNDLDTDLEESVATVMGLAGAVNFTRHDYGIDSRAYSGALEKRGRWALFADTINMAYNRLEALYAQGMPRDEMQPIKDEILSVFEQRDFSETNNARIIGTLPYTRLFPLVYRVYQTHPDLSELGKILRETPDDEEDGIEYLQNAVWMVVH